MKHRTIRVAVFKPGEEVTFEDIRNDLPTLQKTVGGYIEMLRINKGLVLICNEEGKLYGLPRNRVLHRTMSVDPVTPVTSGMVIADQLVGTFFVCRLRGPEMASLKLEDEWILKTWKPGGIWDVGGGKDCTAGNIQPEGKK